jgi:hypothetical protein
LVVVVVGVKVVFVLETPGVATALIGGLLLDVVIRLIDTV